MTAAENNNSRSDKESKMWATFCHLAALVGYIGIPFGNVLGPLVVWLIKKDDLAFVNQQGREALNFQISVTIYGFVAFLLCFMYVGIPLLILVIIGNLVAIIVAAVQANEGRPFRYPLSIRFIK